MRKKTCMAFACLAAGMLAFAAGVALGDFDLSWHATDGGGGGAAEQAPYSLTGVIGQVAAGEAMSGGSFDLQGGFLAGSVEFRSSVPGKTWALY